MKTEEPVSGNWEDLVFERRNKAYGAFTIRRSYSGSLSEAALFSILIVCFALLSPRLLSGLLGEKTSSRIDPAKMSFTLFDPPVIIPVERSVKPPASRTLPPKRDILPVVTADLVPEADMTPAVDLPATGGEAIGGDAIPVDGNVTGIETPVVTPPPAIRDNAEIMPSYAGGLKAMMKFIQKNMKYPRHARQVGTEGKVFVKFVVNYEGKVVNVEIVKGISEDCDREAARVIALMPDWKPGIQNKTPVSVRMVLPINFQLEQ